ncbi:MAG: DUF2029 domain-containing protein [Candidatus Obscuribacterales bacterium]|nr:DUF2029 domain-containing protein [Candidatus Obscuribacterales bacterium]
MTYNNTFQTYLKDENLAYAKDGATYTADYLIYYNSGLLAWDCLKDNKVDIWDPKVQNDSMQKLVPNVKLDKVFYSQYPPYLNTLMMPLSLVPIKIAWVIWELFGFVGIVFGLYSLLSTTLSGKFERALTYVAVLSSFPAWVCFRLAQMALLLYPALVWYWLALERKMWFRAGLLGGFCMLKLQYAPILFLTGCILGGARFFAGYALVGMCYLISCIVVVGPTNIMHYPQALKMGELSGGQITGVSPESQQNLRGQLVVLLGNDGAMVHGIVAGTWLVATIFTAYLWWRYKRSFESLEETEQRRRFILLASITIILQLVTSPHTHKQDYLFISLPAIWLMYNLVGSYPVGAIADPLVKSKCLVLWLRYMLLSFPILSWVFFIGGQMLPLPVQPFFVWAIVLLIVIALILRDRSSSG